MRTKKTYSVNPIRCLTVWKSGLHHGYLLQAYIPIRAYQENGIEWKLTSTMKNDSRKNQPSLESFAPTEIEALSFPILSLIRHSRKDCGDISGEALWRRIQATFGPSKTKWSKSLKRTYIPSNSSPCIQMCHPLLFSFTPASNKHTWHDDTSTVVVGKPGVYEWRDELEHAVENVGTDVIHSLIIDIKPKPATTIHVLAPPFPECKLQNIVQLHFQGKTVATSDLMNATDFILPPGASFIAWLPATVLFCHEGHARASQRSSHHCSSSLVATRRAVFLGPGFTEISNPGDTNAKVLVAELNSGPPSTSAKLRSNCSIGIEYNRDFFRWDCSCVSLRCAPVFTNPPLENNSESQKNYR